MITTNYSIFMASDTESDFAQRGKNKEGRNWLRQVGVKLLVSQDNHIPFYYKEYQSNHHDSKLFPRVMDEVFGSMNKDAGDRGKKTIFFDKGMNSEENIGAIAANSQVNFITTYSTYYADGFIHVDHVEFSLMDTAKNRWCANGVGMTISLLPG